MTTKQEFLLEHNRLSPESLQATEELLVRFRTEKASIFKDNDWSVEKLRRPFIMWLTSLSVEEKAAINGSGKPAGASRATHAAASFASLSYSSYPKKKGISARNVNPPATVSIPAKSRF